jgi:hypothetical protein
MSKNDNKNTPESNEDLMDVPLTFDEIDYSKIKELPINDASLKSIILNGTDHVEKIWIPIWNIETQRLERGAVYIKPVRAGDWANMTSISGSTEEFELNIIKDYVCDSKGNPIGENDAKNLQAGVPIFLMKEIRKISGHFEYPRYI